MHHHIAMSLNAIETYLWQLLGKSCFVRQPLAVSRLRANPSLDLCCFLGECATATHPYGIILAPSFNNTDYSGREFYRVRFGGTTYEKVHPVQMEIINEV